MSRPPLLVTFSVLLALLSACFGTPSVTPTPTAWRPGENRVTQGTVATYGATRLGFVGLIDGRATVAQWSSADDGWLARWRVAEGSLLPVDGQFLELVRLEREQRDIMVLAPSTVLTKVPVPEPDQPLLPQSGHLEIGTSRIEPVGPIGTSGAPVRIYPKLRPLADTPASQIRERTLRVGDQLRIGAVVAKVARIQPASGGLEPLVVFAIE